jgi:sugar phosphate isomerase/epimerase
MGATLDVGQMAACGHDPVDAVRRLAPYLKVVHLKDVAGAGAEHNVLLGTGIANIPGVMSELKKVGFSGLVAIEYEKDRDSNDDMRKQMNMREDWPRTRLAKAILLISFWGDV